jgi:hypothetical protein
MDDEAAGGRALGASLDGACDRDRRERRKGQHRHHEAAAFSEHFQ